MPVDLGALLRPRSAAIFGGDPSAVGRVLAFLVTDLLGPGDDGVRLDLDTAALFDVASAVLKPGALTRS